MLAAVFSMQALGYATANVVALIVTVIVRNRYPEPSARAVDQIWRWVIGLCLIPAFTAAVLRLTIPESPRYTLDVLDNVAKAFDETNRFNNAKLEPEWVKLANKDTVEEIIAAGLVHENSRKISSSATTNEVVDIDQSRIRSKQYFIRDGFWKSLLGTSLCWFLLDIGFFGKFSSSRMTVLFPMEVLLLSLSRQNRSKLTETHSAIIKLTADGVEALVPERDSEHHSWELNSAGVGYQSKH